MVSIILAALMTVGAIAPAAELQVLSVGSINPGLANNGEQFKKDTGNQITIQVDTAPGLSRRLTAGESADILIATADVVDEAATMDHDDRCRLFEGEVRTAGATTSADGEAEPAHRADAAGTTRVVGDLHVDEQQRRR